MFRMLAIALGVLLSLNCGQSFGRDLGRNFLPNVFNLSDTDRPGDSNDMSAKTRVYPNLAAVKYIVSFGQSRAASNSAAPATPYVVTNRSTCINLNPYTDGGFFTADDPILGASASTGYLYTGWHGRLCDLLVNAGWRSGNAIAMIPFAIAGSSITQWKSGAEYGPRILSVATMLTTRGINPEFILVQIGTTDCIAGMSQATFESEMRAVISYWRGLPGRSADKFYITLDTIHDANVVCPAIVAAETAVGGDAGNSVGANADVFTFPTYSDGTHFNDTGNAAMASAHSSKIQANYP